MECETCGGTDFFKESGYFYCNECQTQSQEIREHVFQEEPINVNVKSTRKIKHATSDKGENKITSWECYNIVMCSLTEQLINLGADKKLKQIVKYLWIRYLEKLEILNLQYDELPKLPLINWRRDANIIYNREMKKKRTWKRKRSMSTETIASLDTVSLKRERSKKKRALAQAQYNEFSQNQEHEGSALHSETLTSLKSGSEKSSKIERPTSFNRYSIKELRKRMSKFHCRRHKFDKDNTMKCHELGAKACSSKYVKGIHYVCPIKMYCILYLGLLINKDKIQLGDFMRFIREGHLSFNKYSALLPEDYSNKFINVIDNQQTSIFNNNHFRVTTANLAKFLDVVRYIKVVDMIELSRRFCKEMNLPDEVFLAVENLISKTTPKLGFTNKDTIIPNYEGRAMSLIIFTLKLLFGLDGMTELEFSRYAQLVNSLEMDMPKMFDIMKWLEHVEYRNLVISYYHFPSSYNKNSNYINSDLFLQYVKSKDDLTLDKGKKLLKDFSDYKELLTNLREMEDSLDPSINFPVSFTPFLEYSRIISDITKHDKDSILKANFEEHSLDFLLRPNRYLQMVGENVKIKHGGANDNWVIEKLKSYRTEMLETRKYWGVVPIELVQNGLEKDVIQNHENPNLPNKKYDAQYVQREYEECRQHIFRENEKYLARISQRVPFDETSVQSLRCYNNHFYPHERYWLNLQMNMLHFTKGMCENFLNSHTNTFRLVFEEGARIIEQTSQDLSNEFQFSELFLVFAATYKDKSDKLKKKILLDNNIRYYVNKAEAYW